MIVRMILTMSESSGDLWIADYIFLSMVWGMFRYSESFCLYFPVFRGLFWSVSVQEYGNDKVY